MIRLAKIAIRPLLAVSVGGLAFAACSEDVKARPSEPPSYNVGDGDNIAGRFEHITLNGMPCIVWLASEGASDNRWGRGGLTCDWSQK